MSRIDVLQLRGEGVGGLLCWCMFGGLQMNRGGGALL